MARRRMPLRVVQKRAAAESKRVRISLLRRIGTGLVFSIEFAFMGGEYAIGIRTSTGKI